MSTLLESSWLQKNPHNPRSDGNLLIVIVKMNYCTSTCSSLSKKKCSTFTCTSTISLQATVRTSTSTCKSTSSHCTDYITVESISLHWNAEYCMHCLAYRRQVRQSAKNLLQYLANSTSRCSTSRSRSNSLTNLSNSEDSAAYLTNISPYMVVPCDESSSIDNDRMNHFVRFYLQQPHLKEAENKWWICRSWLTTVPPKPTIGVRLAVAIRFFSLDENAQTFTCLQTIAQILINWHLKRSIYILTQLFDSV